MLYDLEALLINFSVIIIPLFLYQIFWVDKGYLTSRWNKSIIFILTAVGMILCMHFPISLIPGFQFDLRHIPFVLGILYGGYGVGFFLFIINLGYRFLLGGEGAFLNLTIASLSFLLTLLFRKHYFKFNLNQKLLFAVIFSTILSILIRSLPIFMSSYEVFNFNMSTIIFILVQALSTWLIVYIIETMLLNVKMRQELLFTEKLKVISELSASISHEIRNPLTVSMGFLQLLKKSTLTQVERNYYVDLSLDELERAEKIISDYLSLSKAQAENMVTSNLQEEIDYITSLITPYAHLYGVEIVTSFENSLNILYDRNQLRQSFINMAKNSIEAMPEGGKLSITIQSRDSNVLITIKDTGVGMNKEQIDRLGSPYYTTKEKGTGLGMTVVYNAIHSMKGSIQVTSEESIGTTFTIEIPSVDSSGLKKFVRIDEHTLT